MLPASPLFPSHTLARLKQRPLVAVVPTIGNILQYEYPPIKRNDLKNKKWKPVNTHVLQWDLPLGDNVILHWTELDGGPKTTTVTVAFPPVDGLPPVSYDILISVDDNDLGYKLVQRSHSESMIYDTGLINWKMMMIY